MTRIANEPRRFPAAQLRAFTTRVFAKLGVPDDDAVLGADVLAAADLRGIDSHGVARLHTYFDLLTAGRINPRATLRVVRETPSTATVDGDNGLGLVIGPQANEIAMDKAAQAGSGWVAVRNTNHFGIAGYYPLRALERDLIGWAMTNSSAGVAPLWGAERMLGTNPIAMDKAAQAGSGWVAVRNTNHFGIAGYYPLRALERDLIGWAMTNSSAGVAPLWGAERMLGTNPIAIAFPGQEEPAIVIDMATSAVAYGKIEMAQRAGKPIPTGWAIDRVGHPTTDPQAMIDGGALLPLGSERELGGHKGYGLGVMVDVLCAVLSGANWGPFAPPFAINLAIPKESVGKGIGHFFGAMRIDAFRDPEEFKAQIDHLVRTLRATRPAPGTSGPLIPGDPERLAEEERSREGVPLLPAVIADLEDIARRTGVAF